MKRDILLLLAIVPGVTMSLTTGAEEPVDEPGTCRTKVLAVVENQQHATRPQMLDDRIEEGAAPVSPDTEDRTNRFRDQFLVFDRSEVDEPDAVAVGAYNTPGNFDRQASLARSSRADQRDESVFVEPLL